MAFLQFFHRPESRQVRRHETRQARKRQKQLDRTRLLEEQRAQLLENMKPQNTPMNQLRDHISNMLVPKIALKVFGKDRPIMAAVAWHSLMVLTIGLTISSAYMFCNLRSNPSPARLWPSLPFDTSTEKPTAGVIDNPDKIPIYNIYPVKEPEYFLVPTP